MLRRQQAGNHQCKQSVREELDSRTITTGISNVQEQSL